MATIQIRNVDETTYDVLRRRAAASGRSLQEFVRLALVDLAARPTFGEVVAEMRDGLNFDNAPTMDEVVAIIREGRDR